MHITEFGLSHEQRIVDTCFSGYVQLDDNNDELAIGVKFHEPFEGDGILYVELWTDSDDCFCSADTIRRVGPFNSENIVTSASFDIRNFIQEAQRYICLRYIVTNGSFTSGRISARISSNLNAWFLYEDDSR